MQINNYTWIIIYTYYTTYTIILGFEYLILCKIVIVNVISNCNL